MTSDDLRRRRAALRLSREGLARRLGVTSSAVYMWETERRAIPDMLDLAMNWVEQEYQPKERKANMATEYYTISDERVSEVMAAIGNRLTPEQVRDYMLADWNEGDEHQRWLNSAPATEIADWVLAGQA